MPFPPPVPFCTRVSAVNLLGRDSSGNVDVSLLSPGLRFQDVIVVTPDVMDSLQNLDKDEIDKRNQRLKRCLPPPRGKHPGCVSEARACR